MNTEGEQSRTGVVLHIGRWTGEGELQLLTIEILQRASDLDCTGKMRNENKIFVGKDEGKRPLGRTSRRWEGNTGWGVE
jgi:hypothetical protein